jgi:predicted kinase
MKVIIMCGLPGSGKSTLSKNWFPNYFRISQDELGSRNKCIDVMRYALDSKTDVLVDRVNNTKSQRKFWLDLALQAGATAITCVYIQVPEEECIARIHERKGHETISSEMSLDKKREIVYNFNKNFEMPTLDEGFSSILITRN